jgi:hypothetical protein
MDNLFLLPNLALQKILQAVRGGSTGEMTSCCALHKTFCSNWRAAPSAKANICAKDPTARCNLNTSSIYSVWLFKIQYFKLWNPASKGKEVNIRKYILEKVQDILLAMCYLFHNIDQVNIC